MRELNEDNALPQRWVCQTCGHVIRTSIFRSPVEVQVEVTRCADPDCYGEVKLELVGIDGGEL